MQEKVVPFTERDIDFGITHFSGEQRSLVALESVRHVVGFTDCQRGAAFLVHSVTADAVVFQFFLHFPDQVQQILNHYREEQGAEVSLCSNVILSEAASAGSTHELDVAFSINGKFFWVEAKSSSRSIDYGKYAALCEKLKVTSDRLLLVNSDLSVEECEGVSYFWNYRVANCATITGELENMVAKQIETAGKAVPSTD